MSVTTQIFNAVLDTANFNITNDIGFSDFVYLVAPDIVGELAIDIYLQVQVQNPVDLRRIPLYHDFLINNEGAFYYSSISELDTESAMILPTQVKNLEYPKFLAISSNIATTLEVYAVANTRCDCSVDLEDLAFTQQVIGSSLLSQNQAFADFFTQQGATASAITLLGDGLEFLQQPTQPADITFIT